MARLSYQKMRTYSRLRPEDVAVWERFIDKYPAYYESVEYDVKVGQGREYPEHVGQAMQEGAVVHSKKRIDVVGYKGNEIHIIEVKPTAAGDALGQVIEYVELYKEQFFGNETITPVIICATTHPDTERVASRMGVKILIA